VIALASGTQVGPTTERGLLLIAAYCLGLGLPFILLALGARWAVDATNWIRRHIRRVQQVGGVFLIVIGIALVTGLWGDVIAWLRGPISRFTIPV
jgi:cytochrome c-type biogenesis protein